MIDLRPDDLAHARDDVALAIVVAVRDHRAVQTEQHAVDRHRGAELVEDFVAHALVGGLRGGTGRLGPEARALDQLEAFLLGAPPRDPERPGAERAAIRMFARAEVDRLFVARRGWSGSARRNWSRSQATRRRCAFRPHVDDAR